MHEVDTQRVVYGSYGQLWLDGDEIAEIISCKATLTAQKTAIKRSRHLVDGYKTTGYEAKGSIKLHKVSSYLIKKLAPAIKEGKQVKFTLISKLDDPNSLGAERIALYGVMFDAVDLINWDLGKVGEEDQNFTFEDFDLLDLIDEE